MSGLVIFAHFQPCKLLRIRHRNLLAHLFAGTSIEVARAASATRTLPRRRQRPMGRPLLSRRMPCRSAFAWGRDQWQRVNNLQKNKFCLLVLQGEALITPFLPFFLSVLLLPIFRAKRIMPQYNSSFCVFLPFYVSGFINHYYKKPLLLDLSQVWTDADLAKLARLMKKYPSGTPERWEKIAEVMERLPWEITKMAKRVKDVAYQVTA